MASLIISVILGFVACALIFEGGKILVSLPLCFREGVSSAEMAESINRLDRAIREQRPEVLRVFIDSRHSAE